MKGSWLIDGEWLKKAQKSLKVNALFEEVTQSKSIVHVFKGAGGDTYVLRYTYPRIPALLQYRQMVDLDVMSKSICFRHLISLSLFVYMFWGCPLDKSQQCTDWSLRPLSEKQIKYAATDAFVSRAIFLKFWKIIEDGVIPMEVLDNLKASKALFPPVMINGQNVDQYDLRVPVGSNRDSFEYSLAAAKQCPDYDAFSVSLIHSFFI